MISTPKRPVFLVGWTEDDTGVFSAKCPPPVVGHGVNQSSLEHLPW